MKKITILLVLALFSNILLARSKSVIPFEMVENSIFINIEINKKTYCFLFDTGMGITLLSDDLKKEMPLKTTKTNFEATDGNNIKGNHRIYLLKKMKVGGKKIKNAPIFFTDISHIKNRICKDIDGILGASAMSIYIWSIDFDKKEISITRKKDIIPKNSIEIPFLWEGLVPHWRTLIRKDSINLIFDTGFNGNFSIHSKHYDKIKDNRFLKAEGRTSISMYSDKNISAEYCDTMDIQLANHYFKSCFVSSSDNCSNLVGMGFLKNYNITLDFFDKTIYLQPNSNQDKSILHFGIAIYQEDNQLKVIKKYDIEPTKGLQLGDVIYSVNGIDTRKLNQELMCRIVDVLKNSSQLNLTTEKGQKITLDKINLINYIE